MTRFDRPFWEQLWTKTLDEHADVVAGRTPNADLVEVASGLSPGRALDAGCGSGTEALWLAQLGWTVTAVDFSPSALAHGREVAEARSLASRLTWVEGDLSKWRPPAEAFDLVASLYVHIEGAQEAMVRRLASGVAPGGTLLLVGHQPIDPATGKPTPAARQTQVSVAAALRALDGRTWSTVVAEERPRRASGTGVDALIHARRR
ncbi:MAG: class I SAM-dependent methyltransferase [Deltaproteobacteria bacterium]